MSFISEFKEFAMKGNVVDLAVGVIIGAAFGKIVTSFTDDILMPLLSPLTGGSKNLADKFVALNGQSYDTIAAAKQASAPVIAYGNFINTIIQFLILAFAIFLMVKAINHLRTRMEKPAEAAVDNTKTCPYCISKIDINATRCPNCTSQLSPAAA